MHQKLKTVMRRMLFANFVTNPSVVAVLPEQQPTEPTVWGRPLLGQTKAGIRASIAINKKYDARRAVWKNA